MWSGGVSVWNNFYTRRDSNPPAWLKYLLFIGIGLIVFALLFRAVIAQNETNATGNATQNATIPVPQPQPEPGFLDGIINFFKAIANFFAGLFGF